MESIEALRAAVSLKDFAGLIGYTPAGLAYVVYKLPKAARYTTFEIPKKTGGIRTISAPCPQLKLLQKATSDLLQQCLSELDESRGLSGKSVAHGFKKGYSIVTNASRHRNRVFVLNLDLNNFFGEINFGRVRGFFLSSNDFKLNPSVATLIAQIACNENVLPQGSPCSPVISNLVTHILDIRLAKLASLNHARYSRYADDLTFSSNDTDISRDLIALAAVSPHAWSVGAKLRKEIERFGFSINHSKTRLQYDQSRQEVTGLVSNYRVNTSKEYRRTARAMAHTLFKTGTYTIPTMKGAKPEQGSIERLRGVFSFIDHVDKVVAESPAPPMLARTKLYRRLVFYADFYSANKPVVVMEGKTDRVYLRCAIESLVAKYPLLADAGGKGQIQLKVRLHRGTGIAKRFFELDSGAAGLGNFVRNYADNWKGISAPIGASPVIVIVDGDDGFNQVSGPAKKYGKKLDPSEDFLWVCHNLYIVCLPKGKEPEDLFPPALLKEKVAGKKFNPSNAGVTSHAEFGKAYFAQHVVKAQKTTIDFSGFSVVLDRLSAVIKAHGAAAKKT